MAVPGDWVVIAKLQAWSTYIQEQNLLFWKLDFHGNVNFASIFGLGIEKENAVGNGTGPE
jgi:hypothetical protein